MPREKVVLPAARRRADISRAAPIRKAVSLVVMFAFISRQVQAATFNVTNNADSGAGSLRQAITDSNNALGANTILWTAGGNTAIASDLPSLANGTTLDVTGTPSAVTVSGAPNAMALGGAINFNNDTSAQPWTISSVIGGAGSLIKNGAGGLDLSGANTYTGGTTVNGGILNINNDAALGNITTTLTINGGTLQAGGGIFSIRGITLNGAGAFDTNGNVMTIPGEISGAGSLTKVGLGTLYLTNGNAYNGGTFFNVGTVDINFDSALGNGALTFNGGTLRSEFSIADSRAITLNAGGGFFDTAGSTATFYGVFSGGGGLNQISSGTLALYGANTYTGGTLVSGGGVLAVSVDGNLGDPSGVLTLNSGTLRVLGPMSSARGVSLGAGGGTFDTNGFNLSWSGPIGGVGALTKIGGGILTLLGANSYAGGTNVEQDTLMMGANNTMPLNGALTVASGATFDMNGFDQTQTFGAVVNGGTMNLGTSRATMNNGYSGSGTLALTLKQGLTNITGANMNLTGGTLSLKLDNPLVTAGQTFTPIAGTNSGAFASIVSPAAFLFVPTYNPAAGVVLTAQFVPFAATAGSANQSAVGAGIEAIRNAPTGDNAAVLSNLYGLNANQLQSALDQIGPVSLACMSGLGMAASTIQSSAVARRMAVLADGKNHGGYSNYSVSGRTTYPGTLIAEPMGDYGSLGDVESGSPLGFYSTALFSNGRLAEAHSDSGIQPGYAFNTEGFNGGADYRINDSLTAGISLGYLKGHASIYAPGIGTADNDSARYGVYAAGYRDSLHLNAYAGGAQDFFSTHRGVTFGTLSRTATASPRAEEINLYTSAGYDIPTMWYGIFSPFAALNFDQMMIDRFTEDGAGVLNLSVGDQTAKSLRSSLGVRASQQNEWRQMLITTYLSGGWRHEFDNQSRPIDAQLATGAGSAFTVNTGGFARDGTLIGGGVSFDFSKQTTAKLDYTGDFRSHFMDNAFAASLRFKF